MTYRGCGSFPASSVQPSALNNPNSKGAYRRHDRPLTCACITLHAGRVPILRFQIKCCAQHIPCFIHAALAFCTAAVLPRTWSAADLDLNAFKSLGCSLEVVAPSATPGNYTAAGRGREPRRGLLTHMTGDVGRMHAAGAEGSGGVEQENGHVISGDVAWGQGAGDVGRMLLPRRLSWFWSRNQDKEPAAGPVVASLPSPGAEGDGGQQAQGSPMQNPGADAAGGGGNTPVTTPSDGGMAGKANMAASGGVVLKCRKEPPTGFRAQVATFPLEAFGMAGQLIDAAYNMFARMRVELRAGWSPNG